MKKKDRTTDKGMGTSGGAEKSEDYDEAGNSIMSQRQTVTLSSSSSRVKEMRNLQMQTCSPQLWIRIVRRQVIRVKKLVGRQWGAPNSNYLLVMVSTLVMPFSMDPLNPRMTAGCITQK